MKRLILSTAFLIAPLFLIAMDESTTLIMPRVILTSNASKIKEEARCFLSDNILYMKVDFTKDNLLSSQLYNQVRELRDLAKKSANFRLTGDDYAALSQDSDLLLAWLALLGDQVRNKHLERVVSYLANHERKDMLQYLEWHGLKANRFNHTFLDGLANDPDTSKLKKYLLSLKNPKEYNHEGLFQEREFERKFE